MRQRIMTMLAIAAMMASCSKEEVTDKGAVDAGYNSIGFSTYSNLNQVESKGAPVDGNDVFSKKDNTFDVQAFINIANVSAAYLDATIVATADNVWDYQTASDAEFWPSDAAQTLDFYAYANALSSVTMTKANGMTSTAYAVPSSDITAQTDFMYAAMPNAENVTPTNVNDGAVNLHFRHALTQINFTAEVVTNDITVKISDVSICNVKSQGDFVLDAKANTGAVSPTVCEWSNQATLKNYTITPTTAVSFTKSGDGSTTAAGAIDQTDASSVTHELMLIPQTFDAWAATGAVDAAGQTGAYILVTCQLYKTIKDDSNNDVKVYYIGDESNTDTIAIPVAAITNDTPATSPEWIGGRNITYNLKFGAEPGSTGPGGGKDPETGEPTLTPISFTTSVEAWDVYDADSGTAGDQNTNVPM